MGVFGSRVTRVTRQLRKFPRETAQGSVWVGIWIGITQGALWMEKRWQGGMKMDLEGVFIKVG